MGDSNWEGEGDAAASDSSAASEPYAPEDSEREDDESNGDDDVEEENDEEGEEGQQGGGGSGSGGGASPTQRQLEARRQENIRALVSGTGLALRRQALLPRLLTVQQAAVLLRRPFKSPHPGAPAVSNALKRKLAARKTFVPWGGGKFVPLKLKVPPREELPLPVADELPPAGAAAAAMAAAPAEPAVVLPPGVEPLILWEPPAGVEGEPVRVDDMLTQFLRPHQREGVQFMFECVTGLRSFKGQGCILADDMGLGKTLQGISLLWTLLSSRGHPLLGGEPIAKRVIICCPTSLVGNWDNECAKWLKGRVRTLPLCESSRDEAVASILQFLSPRNPYQVMIVSYETFRVHAERFRAEGTCDLLICDEAHRLKNDATLTNRALDSLACRRRVLLSGTPLQNRLDEFYAMVSFCNPGVLGSPAQFRRHFEAPILAGREPDAGEAELQLCQERTSELSVLVNEFILRRTNTLLSQHLPPKVVEIVCCKLTPLQRSLYCHFLESKATRTLFATQKAARVLSAITQLRKLLNHPKLIWDALHGSVARGEEASKEAEGFEGCAAYFPPGTFVGRSARGGLAPGWELLSGKFAVLAGMLELLRTCTRDRIVIVSNYTQTLDLVAQLCRDRGYPFVRLDGTTTIKKRNKLVKDFNDPQLNQFAFLLSSKAGGCGLNLIGGNRLVLFDPSWNPADDKQAAARVWRDGQQKKVYVYRFMAAGSIEEKVYQRQLSKEGLQQVVDSKAGGKSAGPNLMSMDELRDLFSYDPDTLSSTYDGMVCQRPPAPPAPPQAAKGRGAKGKKGGAVSSRRRKTPTGRGGSSSRKKRRRRAGAARRGWDSSSSDSDQGCSSSSSDSEGGFSSEAEKEQAAPFGSESDAEIVVPDSEEEWEGQGEQRAQQGPAAVPVPATMQRSRGGGGMSDSDGWSCSDDEQGGSPDQQQQRQQQGGEGVARQQGPAQPLPATQQLDEADGRQGQAPAQAAAAAGAAAPGSGGDGASSLAQQQEQEQLVPTAVIKMSGGSIFKKQVGKPGEEQLRLWGHHSSTATVPDQVMQHIGDDFVSFVFSLEVDGKEVDPEPPLVPLAASGAQQQGPARPGRSRAQRPAAAAAMVPLSGPAAAQAAAPTATAIAASGKQQTAASSAGAQQHQEWQAVAAAAVVAPAQPARQQQQAVAALPAKENAGANAAAAPAGAGSRLSLPSRPKLPVPAGVKRPTTTAGPAGAGAGSGLVSAVQRAFSSDSDDDFK